MAIPQESINNVLKVLREKGLFSEYLPDNYNLVCEEFDLYSIQASFRGYIEPYKYTMSRLNKSNTRRTIFLPDIASHVALVNYLSENKTILQDILEICYYDDFSFSRIMDKDYEVIYSDAMYGQEPIVEEVIPVNHIAILSENEECESHYSTYVTNFLKKLDVSKGACGILYIDIANFYGSIYTHILPVIKFGFEGTMDIYKGLDEDEDNKEQYLMYKKLDNYVRGLNGNRTNGLLTGPFISKILAEAILGKIDIELTSANIKFTRYADDYEIYIYDEESKDGIKAKIENIFEKYYFRINNEKVKFEKYPFYIFKNYDLIIKRITNSNNISRPTSGLKDIDIIELFNNFFKMEKEGEKGAVRYLLKAYQHQYRVDNPGLYATYLLNILMNDEKGLNIACKIIIEETRIGRINIDLHFKQVIINRLRDDLKDKNDLEAIWLTYLLKNIDADIPDDLIECILKSKNELLIIMVLHEWAERITIEMKNECWEEATSWILQYELSLSMPEKQEIFLNMNGIKRNEFFYQKLFEENFTFYKACKEQVGDNINMNSHIDESSYVLDNIFNEYSINF